MKAHSAFAPLFLSLFGLGWPALLCAQAEQASFDWGPFRTEGSATTGYRFVSIGGYKPTFQQLFDLKSGFRCSIST